MRMYLSRLVVHFKQSNEVLDLTRFSFFYGQIGAGKSTIARLIDYCFGGDIDYTPALQSEFVAVSLDMIINGASLTLYRETQSQQVNAEWTTDGIPFAAILPARKPSGEVVPGTDIYVLSDLVFFLSGVKPPRVRRSKTKEDSALARLSLRDLFWYCYLDQDTIDSEFFHLDAEADQFKRLKSRDVLRFVIGFHQEEVAELESEFADARQQHLRFSQGAEALQEALSVSNVASESDLEEKITNRRRQLAAVRVQIESARTDLAHLQSHAVDTLREEGRQISAELTTVECALTDIEEFIADNQRHLNELLMLSVKYRRTAGARAVLSGVTFGSCPRCAQILPVRQADQCPVCGQPDAQVDQVTPQLQVISADLYSRKAELSEAIKLHEAQLTQFRRRCGDLKDLKTWIDVQLTESMKHYDSAYLSSALHLEHQDAALEQEIAELDKLKVLPRKVAELQHQADIAFADERRLRRELVEARARAESDLTNLKELQRLFLDCLIRAKVPGFSADDHVAIGSPNFLPEVSAPGEQDLIITSFATLGSGGKKTIFKCCFALAMHRLAVQVGALLPSLLIIDSPMKNISERENRKQFEGFYTLLFELAGSELSGTQFILIDKEFIQPPADLDINFSVRHMKPYDPNNDDDDTAPPLISYYRGK